MSQLINKKREFNKDGALDNFKKRFPEFFGVPMSSSEEKMLERITKQNEAKERFAKIMEMRFGKLMSYTDIGQALEPPISRERVRQLFRKYDVDPSIEHLLPPKIKPKCEKCGIEFEGIASRKFCSQECRAKSTRIGKARKDFTKEDWSLYNRIGNNRKTSIDARRRYFEKNKKKLYERNREYLKEYYKRPEVIERNRKMRRWKMENEPGYAERNRENFKRYHKRKMATDPAYAERVRARARERYWRLKDDPEFKRKQRERSKKYYLKVKDTPEYKRKQAERNKKRYVEGK